MKLLFWSSLSLILFAYAGYPICLYVRARLWARPVRRGSASPTVTILIAVHDEEIYLPAKLQNLTQLDYPEDRLQIVVVSDGSSDATNKILAAWQNPALSTVILPEQGGKATALKPRPLPPPRGEVIAFTDARQTIASGALRSLVANFADPAVGCVSGELMIGQGEASGAHGVGLYWRMEKKVRSGKGSQGRP